MIIYFDNLYSMNQGYILHIHSNRREVFEFYLEEYGNFSEPVLSFPYNQNYPYLVFIVGKESFITHVAEGRGGISAGSGMRKMKVDRIFLIESPIAFSSIFGLSSKRVRKNIENSLRHGGILAPESFKEILRCIADINPALKQVISSFLSKHYSFKEWSPKVLQSLSNQKEAVNTALHLTELDRSPLQTWDESKNGYLKSFLDGLNQAYLREDQMINSDLMALPGFDLIRTYSYSRAQFKSGDSDVILDVIVANRTLMEEQTGADLIYYNERYKSFVLVQYKAMEKETGIGPVFRLPNVQLQKEIESMEALSRQLGENMVTHHSHYRLTYNPFFIKLCPRIVFDPNDIKLTPGMYFNIDHWRILEQDEALEGSRGGRLVTFHNVGRHITNTDFVALIKNSWIGTTPVQSAILEKLISEILESGKSLVYAIKRDTLSIQNKLERNFKRDFGGNIDDVDIPF